MQRVFLAGLLAAESAVRSGPTPAPELAMPGSSIKVSNLADL